MDVIAQRMRRYEGGERVRGRKGGRMVREA